MGKKVYKNIDDELIYINSDRLAIIINKKIQIARKMHDWVAPLSISITVFIAMCTTEFHDTFGVPKETLFSIFTIILSVSFFYLFYAFIHTCKNRKKIATDIIIGEIAGVKQGREKEKLKALSQNKKNKSRDIPIDIERELIYEKYGSDKNKFFADMKNSYRKLLNNDELEIKLEEVWNRKQ
jgi:hypothetical protein